MCDKENPQHEWTDVVCGTYSWKECQRNADHKEGTEGHQYAGSGPHGAGGHACKCGRKTQEHSFGSIVLVSRVGFVSTYRHTCTVCAYEETWEENEDPCKNGHIPLDDACGCLCGYYSPTNHVSREERFHHFTAGGKDGNPACLCDCMAYHKFANMTTAERNRFPASTNCIQCPNICWTCRERDINGRVVAAYEHTPFYSLSDQRGAARCGCMCGKTASDSGDTRFHYRNSTGVGGLPSCLCYGVNAKATGASAGRYHFRDPSACSKVCSVVHNGRRHLAATELVENSALSYAVTAKPKDHTKKDGYGVCGCKCEAYTSANLGEWNGEADLHRRATRYLGRTRARSLNRSTTRRQMTIAAVCATSIAGNQRRKSSTL